LGKLSVDKHNLDFEPALKPVGFYTPLEFDCTVAVYVVAVRCGF
jgi:hypothetical protein